MNVEEIRNAFSKGGVIITHEGIVVTYTFKERWLDQSFFDDSRRVLLELLESSDKLIIECAIGKIMKFVFHNDLSGQEMVFYPPVSEELSLKDLKDILQNSRDDAAETEFYEFFYGVDLDDKDEVLDKLRELFERKQESTKTNIVSLPARVRWKTMSKLAVGFANSLGFRYEILEPDFNDFDGAVTVYFPDNMDGKIVIEKEPKLSLEKIIDTGSVTEIECNINNGFLNLVFYA